MIELLEAIYASPEDDAPRLVYADWLIERGDPRGEFIVRQCNGDAAHELLLEHEQRWLGELLPVLAARSFERGFLATARIGELPAIRTGLIGHPSMRLLRELRTTEQRPGVLEFAVHPSMTELRVLRVANETEHWPELLAGRPRDLVELHYQPKVEESWDPDGDVTATPYSGGVWTTSMSHDEFAALAECVALPKLRHLVLSGVPNAALRTVFGGTLLDRVPLVETRHGPIAIKIAGGLATITVAPTASPYLAQTVLELIRLLPASLGIELTTGPRFENRALIESALGNRLRR